MKDGVSSENFSPFSTSFSTKIWSDAVIAKDMASSKKPKFVNTFIVLFSSPFKKILSFDYFIVTFLISSSDMSRSSKDI
jgi:hypothetical protein